MAVSTNIPQGQKRCPRCNKSFTKDAICSFCRQELVQQYDYQITWQVAWEIEQEVKLAKGLRLRF